MKKIFFIAIALITLSASAQTPLTEAQLAAQLTSTAWPFRNTAKILKSFILSGINTYTNNTAINNIGTFLINPSSNYSVTPGGTLIENATGLHTISSASLSITGSSLKITNGAGANKVLTSDASGYATWATASISSATNFSTI